jgi:hypothetical protein
MLLAHSPTSLNELNLVFLLKYEAKKKFKSLFSRIDTVEWNEHKNHLMQLSCSVCLSVLSFVSTALCL